MRGSRALLNFPLKALTALSDPASQEPPPVSSTSHRGAGRSNAATATLQKSRANTRQGDLSSFKNRYAKQADSKIFSQPAMQKRQREANPMLEDCGSKHARVGEFDVTELSDSKYFVELLSSVVATDMEVSEISSSSSGLDENVFFQD